MGIEDNFPNIRSEQREFKNQVVESLFKAILQDDIRESILHAPEDALVYGIVMGRIKTVPTTYVELKFEDIAVGSFEDELQKKLTEQYGSLRDEEVLRLEARISIAKADQKSIPEDERNRIARFSRNLI